jgi:hypothetical protein
VNPAKSRKRGAPQSGKQTFTTAPKKGKGKLKMARHDMGAIFARSPKKPESDMPPRTRQAERSARRARLTNKFI